mmetsp:Transcript_41511/g.61450  ORF Transcript_41511/g.61450 Transcript_41511/m.61450 type:complete len:144 (-) Transcript_41511:64-495(-)
MNATIKRFGTREVILTYLVWTKISGSALATVERNRSQILVLLYGGFTAKEPGMVLYCGGQSGAGRKAKYSVGTLRWQALSRRFELKNEGSKRAKLCFAPLGVSVPADSLQTIYRWVELVEIRRPQAKRTHMPVDSLVSRPPCV